MRKKQIISSIFGIFLLIGCVFGGKTVKCFLNDADFQKENLPIRTLYLAIATDGSCSDEKIMKLIKNSSDLMKIQTGIELKIKAIMPIAWTNQKTIEEMLYFLKAAAEKWTFDFDMAIGITALPESENDTCMGITNTSNTSRIVIIRSLQSNILMHEIFHSINMSARHSGGGLMKSWLLLEVNPDELPRDEDIYLSPEDRKTILQNKWRRFK